MRFPGRLALSLAVCAMIAHAPLALAASVIERDIVFGPDRVRVEMREGRATLATPGAVPEARPGHPDVPWYSERVSLPAGTRVASVEVMELESQPVADGVRLPSAMLPKANSTLVERSEPDPAFFTTDRVQPESPVELGTQGTRRGATEAWLRVSPVRWTPSTGRLERITRLRVRLTLAEVGEADIAPRLRVVPEWEEDGASADEGARLREGTLSSSLSLKRKAEPFKATQLPSLLGSPVEYLIVTNEAMRPQFERLATWKTQSGIPAVVRTMEFVRQQYPRGADDAERLRSFIRDAYSRWGTKYVLLGGDTEVIPTRYSYTTFYAGNLIATDQYYACLDGNWNADGDSTYGEGKVGIEFEGDSCDLFPEVYVGRAPTVNLAEAQQFVDKVFQYSRTPVGDYENNLLLFAEVLFPQDYDPGMYIVLDGAALVEDILPTLNAAPGVHYGRLYENYPEPTYLPGALPLSKTAVLDSLDLGYNIAVHVGHGYRNVMMVGDESLDNNDASSLTNGNRLTNLYAINCTSNAIDFPSIGEAFMHCATGGAVSNIGSTHFDFPTAGRAYQLEYFKLLFRDSVTALGEAQAKQKFPFIAFSVYDGVNRWTQMTLLLLGDPEMRVWTSRPRQLQVTHAGGMSVIDSTFAVNVKIAGVNLYKARVTAYRENDDFATGLTDGAGNITLPFRPDSLGTFTVTVTGFNCRPYQATVSITPTGLPLVADPGFTIDDDNLGGTFGNADGRADAGETVDLSVPLRNNGGSTAPAVTATLVSLDPQATVTVAGASYGSIAPGVLKNPVAGFRFSTPYSTDDQREVPFTLTIFDGAGHSRVEKLQVTLSAPEIAHYGQAVLDLGGNSDGVADPGEVVSYYVALRNEGTGRAPNVSVKLRNYDGLATVLDSTASYGDIPAGSEQYGDAVVFTPSSTSAQLELRISDVYGLIRVQTLDLLRPDAPISVLGTGAATSITLTWARSGSPDLFGYNVYRSTSPGGPYNKVNLLPTDRTSYYLDSGLAPLTPFYYRITAVDSSGNESSQSASSSASTNPPTHTIFPIPMGGNTPSSVAVDHVYPGYPVAIFAGADLLYGWHPDGSAPVDADGAGATSGDFSELGKYFAAGPSIADLTGDGIPEIIAPTWTDTSLYVFQRDGTLLPGWPLVTRDPIWSSVAVGDLNNDGSPELVFGANNQRIYAMRANGTEWMDGDSNPATTGVFKVLGQAANFATPALADLDGDGYLDIVYASYDGNLYAWNRFGANLPGFPVAVGGACTASPAIGYLDGPGDTQLDIVVPNGGNYLFVVRADGTMHPGFPQFMKTDNTSKTPSPALADMNGDGYLDIVAAATNGYMLVWDRNGSLVTPWNNVKYTPETVGTSESSPVVADINGDGLPDIVMGGEDGRLAALGNNGQMLPGFPIPLAAEIRGTPALCDCDGDGMTEIVLAGWDKLLHMWDYNFPFSPGVTPQWPQFHHDARRTGLYSSPVSVAVGDGILPMRVELALPAPNPARRAARMDYAIPSSAGGQSFDLSVFDLSGRRLATLASGVARAGRYTASWDLRDSGGEAARTGVYFVRFRIGAEQRAHKLLVVR